MNISRSGERPTFAWLSLVSAGAICAALTACGSSGASSLTGGEGWGAGATPSGGGVANTAAGGSAGSGASGMGSGGSPSYGDGGGATGADGGATGSTDAGPAEDTGSPLTTLALIDTNVNTLPMGEPIVGYDPLTEHAQIDVAKVGTGLSIRADTTPAKVTSVLFVLDNVYAHTELAMPYMLCGDDGAGTIVPCPDLTVGSHTLVVTPALADDPDAGADGGEHALASTTLDFTIVDSDAGTPEGGATGSGLPPLPTL